MSQVLNPRKPTVFAFTSRLLPLVGLHVGLKSTWECEQEYVAKYGQSIIENLYACWGIEPYKFELHRHFSVSSARHTALTFLDGFVAGLKFTGIPDGEINASLAKALPTGSLDSFARKTKSSGPVSESHVPSLEEIREAS